MNLIDRRRFMARAGGIVKKIVTGVNGIVNYTTNLAMPSKITCEFVPAQSGSGEPSPTNVRSISGYTGCNITHNANTITIDWSSDIGTVYGGSYIINEDGSVDVIVEWARYDYLSDSPINQQSSNNYIQIINNVEYGVAFIYTGFQNNKLNFGELANITDLQFNKIAVFRNNASIAADYAAVASAANTSSYIRYFIKSTELDDVSTAATTKESIRSWLYENQVYFVAKLRTPITYHFDNIGVMNSFIGQNNILYDINGTITVEYYFKE